MSKLRLAGITTRTARENNVGVSLPTRVVNHANPNPASSEVSVVN
jgi:hypothetical protein